MDPFDAFSLTRDGHRSVGRFLGVGGAMQPHDAIGIGIDVQISQARDVFGSKLRLHLGRDRRILDERLRVRTIRVRVLGGYRHDRPEQYADDHQRRR